MSFVKPKKIEEYVVFHLKKGSQKCLDLVSSIQASRPNTTKQAVYASLRQLRSSQHIIITKGVASLNIMWLNQMQNFFELARSNYLNESNSGDFLNLKDGEKIFYLFKDAHRTDIFWTHAYYLLMEKMKPQEPAYLYNTHEWFYFARPENEKDIINATLSQNHPLLLTVGGNTFLDSEVASFYDGTIGQYNMLSNPLFDDNYYLNVLGDFIIEVWLDKKVAQQIENIYQKTSELSSDVINDLKRILETSGRMKIAISRNHKKANKLKKSLSKYFALKREEKTKPNRPV